MPMVYRNYRRCSEIATIGNYLRMLCLTQDSAIFTYIMLIGPQKFLRKFIYAYVTELKRARIKQTPVMIKSTH